MRKFLAVAKMDEDSEAKALANFLFRSVIENAHTAYNISQKDMEKMCREAVNKAAAFLEMQKNPAVYEVFQAEGLYGLEWDAVDKDEVERIIKRYESLL